MLMITPAREGLTTLESFIVLTIERQGRDLDGSSAQTWRARRAFCKSIIIMYVK